MEATVQVDIDKVEASSWPEFKEKIKKLQEEKGKTIGILAMVSTMRLL